MFVYVCIYLYTYVYLCMHAHIHIYIPVCLPFIHQPIYTSIYYSNAVSVRETHTLLQRVEHLSWKIFLESSKWTYHFLIYSSCKLTLWKWRIFNRMFFIIVTQIKFENSLSCLEYHISWILSDLLHIAVQYKNLKW